MLITLEGIDGAGKTTVWEALRDSVDAVFTKEPTDSWYGECVRQSLTDEDADPLAELFLYTADHADHLARVIRPALDRGELVISDRYADSRYAYQGASLDGVIPRPLEYVQDVHQPFTRPPDATIYLDIPPQKGAERAGANDKFEQTDHLETVRENYERLIDDEPDRFVRIDADRPAEAVIDDVEQTIERLV